ncbi:MAG: prephenate dehydratase [Planctomycetes bacterium]|nr:prephenate dehydratase [Planctomycetota bacterium]
MSLDDLRKIIDDCDKDIVRILNERAKAAHEIGAIKIKNGQGIFAPEREKAVYDKVDGLNEGPFQAHSLHAVYREIMSACIALEKPTRIAYFGPSGTFTHQAAISKFGNSMEYLPQPQIRDVFLAVMRGHADYGFVPIENSTEGAVNATSDMLIESGLKICSEVFLEIHQTLLCNCELKDIKIVISHPQALAQCRSWLAANLPGVPVREVASTAHAAERASREQGVAAIASEVAASLYNLNNVINCIEDKQDNTTRFVALAHTYGKPSGDDRTSIVFSVLNKSGSLYEALLPFKNNNINLTRIESRPSKKKNWEYSFFVDIDGHVDDPAVKKALEELKDSTDDFVHLGSYPKAAHLVRTSKPVDGLEQADANYFK